MINREEINGEGHLLWCVILVDKDDPEDTTVQFWLATDADDLYDQIKVEWDIDKVMEEQFAWDWGYCILPRVIGAV
jgi:hypothetical protein